MNWDSFKGKFHTSWHAKIRKFIESNECNKIFAFLKNQKKEIAPTSNNTFKAFKQNLRDVKCVIIFDEPYCEKKDNMQYADGIPLSCSNVDKIHPWLDAFYNAMEKEFYDLNLNIIKDTNLNYYTNQGVLFLSSSLTTEIGCSGKHKKIWTPFMKWVLSKIIFKKEIPVIYVGEETYNEYKAITPPVYPYFIIKQNIRECNIGVPWNTNNVFTRLNDYLLENTDKDEVMWVHQDVPF